jgi:hypothetical protein
VAENFAEAEDGGQLILRVDAINVRERQVTL